MEEIPKLNQGRSTLFLCTTVIQETGPMVYVEITVGTPRPRAFTTVGLCR